jgi:hypothetical protein
MESINERLAGILLVEKGLTAYRIGKDIGTSTKNIDNWLKIKAVMPGADWVAKICYHYKINPSYALLGVGSKYENIIIKHSDTDLVNDLVRKTQKIEAVKAQIKAIQIIIDSEDAPAQMSYTKKEEVRAKK